MASHRRFSQAPYPVTHAFHVEHPGVVVDTELVRDTLSGMEGVLSVKCDAQVITLTYDLRQVHLQEIEAAIQGMGMTLQHGLWPRLHHLATHVVEELEDNNQAALACHASHEYDPFFYRKLQKGERWVSVYPPTDRSCSK